MFRKPTAFILGAGASWHYGYPTGEQLVREVAKKGDVIADYFRAMRDAAVPIGHMPEFVRANLSGDTTSQNELGRAWHVSVSQSTELTRRLRNVDPLVIDYFLGQNGDLQKLGKMLIAWVIRERETLYKKERRNSNRQQAAEDNWVRFVLHRLIVGCTTSEQLLSNRVSFVTFNYDMSLEDQIAEGLRANSLFGMRNIQDFLSENRFLHVYGDIRGGAQPVYSQLSSLYMENGKIDPAFAKSFFDDLFHASEGIQTIDPHEKSDELVLRPIRNAIAQAECIYILGFGFDRRNCERIGLTPSALARSSGPFKKILFTNFENSNRVNKAASKAFLGYANAFWGDSAIYDQPGSTNYHEKSVRDCYNALALDFDEIEDEYS